VPRAYIARLAQAARRLFSSKGPDVLEDLAPELQAGITIENAPFEYLLVSGKIPWTARVIVAGAAGVFTHGVIRNPANSGIMSVIEGFLIANRTGAASPYDLQINTAAQPALTTQGQVRPRDLRIVGQPATIMGTINNAAEQGIGYGELYVPTLSAILVPHNALLAPGTDFYWVPGNLNQEIFLWVFGYERQLESSESAVNAP
jgi:hypothetical protein